MYNVKVLPRAQKDLDKFRGKIFDELKDRISCLKGNPRPFGAEKMTREEGYRIKFRNIRILYKIYDESKKVLVYRVKHRKDAYR